MKRREFILALGGAAASMPLAARAQQSGVRRVGVLSTFAEDDPEGQSLLDAFQQRLRVLGWVAGRNVQFEIRRTIGSPERAQAFAAEFADMKPGVVLMVGGTAASALLKQTRTVPAIFVTDTDPVAAGFVASLAKLQFRRGGPVFRIDQCPNGCGFRQQRVYQLQSLWRQRSRNNAYSSDVAAGQRSALFSVSRKAHSAGGCNGDPDDLPVSRFYGGRRTDQLRSGYRGYLSAGGALHRQDTERGTARRSADPAADQVRTGHQPEDRQEAWS